MKKRTIYTCSQCGEQYQTWLGKCPSCNAFNTMVEETYADKLPEKAAASSSKTSVRAAVYQSVQSHTSKPITELESQHNMRLLTGFDEFDRVLGGGLVCGSVVLVSGEPGIGKSTLLLQICQWLSDGRRILYVSGEESSGQIQLRAKRLGVSSSDLYILTETQLGNIHEEITSVSPEIVIIDSIQTLYDDNYNSSPGSITQVKESSMSLMKRAKSEGITIIIVGHVNKEGGIAGPKVLEHMVDTVLYFEGERQQSYRIIRAIKNRFGSTNEIGVFEMLENGLSQVENPSEMLLSGRPKNVSGSCAICVVEGTRPIIAEIQALVTPTVYPSPRRTSTGVDYNRTALLLAVIEKRLGLRFSTQDAYVNVVGGLHLEEPACDLPIALALISSLKDKPINAEAIAFGEIGLAGEIRAVSNIEQRLKEAERLGFKRAYIPYRNVQKLKYTSGDMEIHGVRSIFDSLKALE